MVLQTLSEDEMQPDLMCICFSGNNQVSEQLCVAMISIIRNMRPFDNIDFFVLENDITNANKRKIKKLEQKNVSINFIHVDITRFEQLCPTGLGCPHVSMQTYFRYIIPKVFPHYEKVLYLDVDMVVRKSLHKLWETELGDNYAAVVQEQHINAVANMKIQIPLIFNAGMLLLNNKKLIAENITEKLFHNTQLLKDKIVFLDQDILNYTFQNKIVWVSPIYNAQNNLWRPEICAKCMYSEEEMQLAKSDPVIVHYNGSCKPWLQNKFNELRKYHPFAQAYFDNLKQSPYKPSLLKYKYLYFKYNIMFKITWGEKRKKYKQKKAEIRALLKSIWC